MSPSNFLRNITLHLEKKWLSKCAHFYHLEYYPDKSRWLKNINIFNGKDDTPSALSENYLIEDIFSAYDHPENKVLYLFYEIKENVSSSRFSLKKEQAASKMNGNTITQPLSKEKSEENYLFAHNLLKNMDLLKNPEELPSEDANNMKNIKDLSCTNFLNINDLTNKEQKNSQFFHSKRGKFMENSVFSLNNLKKSSINFSNFSALSDFKEEYSEPCSKRFSDQNDVIIKSKGGENNLMRKDMKHLSKIIDLVDMVGKKYENLAKN